MTRWLWLLVLIGSLLGTEAFACQKYGANVQDDEGNILGGVAVTVTIYASPTFATIYSDPACAATAANPLTSNSDGSYNFYTADGHFSLSFVKSGYTIAPVVDIVIFEPLGANVKSVAEFASPDDVCAAITGAIAATTTTVRTLYVNAAVACTLTSTAPSNLAWVFIGKGSLTVSSGQTLTINGPVMNLTDHAVWLGSGTTIFGAGTGPDPYGKRGITTVTYSATMTIDASLGETFRITPTDAVAFAIALPTRPAYNRLVRIEIINTTGGALGAATFTGYKKGAAWTQPATGFTRFIEFRYDGSSWKETSRSAADVSN